MSNITTSDQVSNALEAWYNPTLLDIALPNLLANQFGQMKSIPKGNSKTIRYGRYEELPESTTALTEGIQPDGHQLTVTRMDAICSQYGRQKYAECQAA